MQGWEDALWRACCSLLSTTGCHSSWRNFTTDIGYGKNNECLQRLRGGLGHCMVPKTVFTLPPPPPQYGTYFKVTVVLLRCKNLTFNRLVKLCTETKRSSGKRSVEWSLSKHYSCKAQRDFTSLFWRFVCLEFYWLSHSDMAKKKKKNDNQPSLCSCTNLL